MPFVAPTDTIIDLDHLPFDNRFTRDLPAESLAEASAGSPGANLAAMAHARRQVRNAAYTRVAPTPVTSPRTLIWAPEVASMLGLDPSICRSEDFAQIFAGNRVPIGADPYAACYGGHQFGNWAGQLGDGRAIALGEIVDACGDHQTLQLKGAGPTPYSRSADGRAVLRSSIREFLCSEAMHNLGVPTTRALALIATGDDVVRDMLYDGHPRPEPGAVVCRVAPSFIRFGTFQLPASRDDVALLHQLVEYTIRNHFGHLLAGGEQAFPDLVARWFAEVCTRTAALAVNWMRVGFVHGVLNTDNMSILGLTIDYGPYGWLENFDPGWTPNTTDAGMHRYKFGTQPEIIHWNLLQLAQALVPLVDRPDALQAALDQYRTTYDAMFEEMLAERLGIGGFVAGDERLFEELFALLVATETDYLLFFRHLADVPVGRPGEHDAVIDDDRLLEPLRPAYYCADDIFGVQDSDVRAATVRWLRTWANRVRAGGIDDTERRQRMNAVNPRFVLRNYLAQEAIDLAEQGDLSLVHELLDVLRRPYDDQLGRERFAARRPEWARHRVGCSMLSCSS